MKERSIIFSAPMVRAILDGRKTQTRRTIKPQPEPHLTIPRHMGANYWQWVAHKEQLGDVVPTWRCPYEAGSMRLWVREAVLAYGDSMVYAADGIPVYCHSLVWPGRNRRIVPPIHMPRMASRITLEITGARAERLHEISPSDCWAEGISATRHSEDRSKDLLGSVKEDYRQLWEAIHGPDSWSENPWVWVIEFELLDKKT